MEKNAYLHHNDLHAHTSQQNWWNLAKNCHLLHLELAHCDFFLFPYMKNWPGEKQLLTDEKNIAETEVYFAVFNKSYFFGWFENIKISLNGIYRAESKLQ